MWWQGMGYGSGRWREAQATTPLVYACVGMAPAPTAYLVPRLSTCTPTLADGLCIPAPPPDCNCEAAATWAGRGVCACFAIASAGLSRAEGRASSTPVSTRPNRSLFRARTVCLSALIPQQQSTTFRLRKRGLLGPWPSPSKGPCHSNTPAHTAPRPPSSPPTTRDRRTRTRTRTRARPLSCACTLEQPAKR